MSNHHRPHQKQKVAKRPIIRIFLSIRIATTTITIIHVVKHNILELAEHMINIFQSNELQLVLNVNQRGAPWCT
jgi:hypothetical protein